MKNRLLVVLLATVFSGCSAECPSDGAFFCWQYKSAEQGDAGAQNILSLMYSNGRGVTQDTSEAVRWYRKAAEQGVASAQYNLGGMYWNGEGVIEDDSEAFIWFSIAKANGDKDAADVLRTSNWILILDGAEIKSAQLEAAQRLETIRGQN